MAGISKKNIKRPRKHRVSSGTGRMSRARQALRRVRIKIKRWKKNRINEKKKHSWHKKQNPHLRSRHNNWDTTGLERYIKVLESIIKKGKTRKK